jgi:hypothetical protein
MLKQWLRYLWENEDGFFGVGMGPSAAQKSEAGALGAIGNFATSEGEADITLSDKFWQAILSGDPGQIAKVLGPSMSAANKQGQQAKKTTAEFGNRGGGTNAAMQTTDSSTRSSIDEMISRLTGTGASTLGSTGSGLLSTGTSAHGAAFGADTTIHDEREAQWNDIFKSSASVIASLLGGKGGDGGGGGGTSLGSFMSPGQISSAYGGPSSAETTTSDTPWALT